MELETVQENPKANISYNEANIVTSEYKKNQVIRLESMEDIKDHMKKNIISFKTNDVFSLDGKKFICFSIADSDQPLQAGLMKMILADKEDEFIKKIIFDDRNVLEIEKAIEFINCKNICGTKYMIYQIDNDAIIDENHIILNLF